jgi:MinD-like ATPase involved in chromosome partitioning or flagellar assembly
MPDQADKLRQLMNAAAPRVIVAAALPPTIVVTGGKGGVGATTVAINLAAALAQNGRRTVLVDAATHADAAQLLDVEIERGGSLEDVLSGACTSADALVAGPAGISLLASRWASDASPDRSLRSFDKFIEHLQSLDPHVDALVIDSGSGLTNWTRGLWQLAELVLLVTTPDDIAVMDTYATIKHGLSEAVADLRILVNQSGDTSTAVDVQSRLAASCRRFLGRTIARAPLLPRHAAEGVAGSAAPLAWEAQASPFGRSVNQLGRFAADVLSQHHRLRREECELSPC